MDAGEEIYICQYHQTCNQKQRIIYGRIDSSFCFGVKRAHLYGNPVLPYSCEYKGDIFMIKLKDFNYDER